MFTEKSRYRKTEQYLLKDRRGRKVHVVAVPNAPQQSIMGRHQLKQGQRIDHLAANYTKDESGFWRIAEINDILCKGCGTCVAACPSKAIIQNHFDDVQILPMIETAIPKRPQKVNKRVKSFREEKSFTNN